MSQTTAAKSQKSTEKSRLIVNNMLTRIGADSVRAEAERMFTSSGGTRHDEVFDKILEQLTPIDFHDEANLDEGQKVTQKDYVVLTVRHVLKTARSLNLDLRRRQDFPYSFNGEFWAVIEREDLERFLMKCAEKLGVPKITAIYHKFVAELSRQFVLNAGLSTPIKSDKAVLINLRNGTFEVLKDSFNLREFRREDFLTYQLDFNYDKTKDCPKWKAFLDEVLPDKSCQDILAEYIGYVFARQLKLEKTMILYGTGANGKSVVFEVVNSLLGAENVSNFSLENLCHEYYRAMIANKLLNYSSEISVRMQTDKFKQLTSGEPIEARLPYGRPMTLTDYARLAFNTNSLPKDVEHTEAFFRRFLIIPFDITIPAARRNPNLAKEIIENELSGVFNWMLEGLQRILDQKKFSDCVAAAKMLTDYRKTSDSVAMFIEEENYKATSKFTTLRDLYESYKEYCVATGYKALGRNNFGKRLEANGFSRQDRSQPVFFIEKMPKVSI